MSANPKYLALQPLIRQVFCVVFCLALVSNAIAIEFDTTFGSGGKFMTWFADAGQPSSAGSKVFLQASGRLVIVGYHQQDSIQGRRSGFGLAGLTPGGVLDSSFGTAGRTLFLDSAADRYFIGSLMLSDGSIVVLYQMWQTVGSNRPGLARFTPNGQPDSTFQVDLDVTPNQTSPILVAKGNGGKLYVLLRNFASTLFSLIRLNEDGSRDLTFGPNGLRTLPLNRFSHISRPTVTALTEVENGKLLVAGNYTNQSFGEQTFFARFDSDTNIDRSFGRQGVAQLSIPGGGIYANVVTLQPDGKILIAGAWVFLGSNTFLMRLTPRGRPDVGFGNSGIAMTSFNDTNGIRGLAVAPDGKIIVAGSSGDKAIPSNQRLFVIRYSSTGVRESFLVTNFITTREAAAYDVVLQADGKMIIAGFTQNAADNLTQFAAARFVP